MARTCMRLFLVVLCLSYLMSENGAIIFTRSRNLQMQKPPQTSEVPRRVLLGINNYEKSMKMEITRERRMEIEVNDYPGSGANNRHTPRSQMGRGCIDC